MSRRKIGFLAIVGLLALGGLWLGWSQVSAVLIVRKSIPARPDLAARPATLVREIDDAASRSRSFFQPVAGLANLAQLYHANAYFDEARRCYEGIAKVQPNEPRWPHLIANVESTRGDSAAAIPWQQRAAHLAPTVAVTRLRLADMLFKTNLLAEAEAEYRAVLQIAPKNPYALLGLARCRERSHEADAARQLLQQAVEAQPDFSPAWALIASMETQRGDQVAALAARKRSEVRFRDMDDPWVTSLADFCYDPYQLSVVADATKDRQRARELLERAIAIAPDVSSYHRQLAKLLLASQEKNLARQHLEKAVALTPTDSESWSSLVTLLAESGDRRAGAEALDRALRLCPESGYLHFLNGNRLQAMTRLVEAEQEYKAAKRLQPAEIRSYVQLSGLYVAGGRFKDALEEARGANAADPANPAVLGMLARLSIMIDDPVAATSWIRAIRAQPRPDQADLAQLVAMFRSQYGRDPN